MRITLHFVNYVTDIHECNMYFSKNRNGSSQSIVSKLRSGLQNPLESIPTFTKEETSANSSTFNV